MGSLRVGHDWATLLSLFTFMHGEGNGNPLQCSCLENPRDGGAWWAAVYGVAQSWTRLKWLSSSSSMLKSRDITSLTKVHILKAMVFPVIMYGCKSGTIKKAEHQRIDAFKLWYWGRLLRVSWTARRSNQSILKKINPEYYWKDWCWSSNTLATWCEQPIHWKGPWWWERLKVEGEEGDRGWDGWMALPTQCTWVWANSKR